MWEQEKSSVPWDWIPGAIRGDEYQHRSEGQVDFWARCCSAIWTSSSLNPACINFARSRSVLVLGVYTTELVVFDNHLHIVSGLIIMSKESYALTSTSTSTTTQTFNAVIFSSLCTRSWGCQLRCQLLFELLSELLDELYPSRLC